MDPTPAGTSRQQPASAGTSRHQPASAGTSRHQPASACTCRHQPTSAGICRYLPAPAPASINQERSINQLASNRKKRKMKMKDGNLMVKALLSEVVKEAFVSSVHSVHFFSLVKSRLSQGQVLLT